MAGKKKTKGKMLLGFFFIIALATALGITSYVMLSRVTAIANLDCSFHEMQVSLLELRRAEKNFLLRETTNPTFFSAGESEYVNKFKTHYELIQINLKSVEEQLKQTKSESLPKIRKIKSSLELYNTKFLLLTSKIKEKGFNNFGLRGDLKESALAIEEIEITDSAKLSLLTIKRHEKNYFLRHELIYVDIVQKEILNFKSLVEASDLSPADKDKSVQLIDDYKTKFDKIIAIDQEIGLTPDSGIKGEFISTVPQIELLFGELHEEILDMVRRIRKITGLTIIAFLTIIIVLGLGMGFYKSPSKPVIGLVNLTQKKGKAMHKNRKNPKRKSL